MLKKILNINNWLIIFFSPLSIFFLITILILRPIIRVRLGEITAYRFGHYLKNVETYLSDKKINNLNSFDIFILTSIKSNSYVEKMCKRHIKIIPFQILFVALKIINKFNFLKYHLIDMRSYDYDLNFFLDRVETQIKFKETEKKHGDKLLSKIGISQDDKVVCFCSRDESYPKKYLTNYNDRNYWKIRNTNIDDYNDAMKKLSQMGYKIVRMGKFPQKKISLVSDNIIDYAFSNYRNDFLDIYLAYRCDFAICDSSGWWAAPAVFRKNIGLVNFIPLKVMHYYSKKFTFIFKKHFDENNDLISIEEIIKKNIYNYNLNDYKKNNVKIVDNTSLEIMELALEVEKKFREKFQYSKKYLEKKYYLLELLKNFKVIESSFYFQKNNIKTNNSLNIKCEIGSNFLIANL